MVFMSKTCLYVSSMPRPQIHEKKFLNFSKWRIFFNSLLFSDKMAFMQISADFVTRFEKILLHLKDLWTRMYIDVNNFFVAQVVPEIFAKNTSFKISQMYIFVINCSYRSIQHGSTERTPRHLSCAMIQTLVTVSLVTVDLYLEDQ